MKNLLILFIAATGLWVSSCYKDKGNYDYSIPEEPLISNIDSVYSVQVGDSLIVSPVISFSDKSRLSYEWRISVPERMVTQKYTDPELRIVFGLLPKDYNVRLAVYDSANGMKYFRDFVISGRTGLSVGSTVLSNNEGVATLSFIKPDGTVAQNLFEEVNGRPLRGEPLQVIPVIHQYVFNGLLLGYWVTTTDQSEGGVMINPDTFEEIRTLKNNFFTPPATVTTGYLRSSPNGVLEGVINGHLYVGATQTYYGSEIYGYFGVPAEGDYQAFRKCPLNPSFPFYFGYEVNRKQFIGFTNFGSPAYVGTNYQALPGDGFDPLNVGLDLLNIEQVNAVEGYAMGKGSDGIVYELKYNMGFIGLIQITPVYKRPFARQDLITATTKWQVTPAQIFYFTSGDKIYRYNPLNESIVPLAADFGGNQVSMIKIMDNGNTLIAGVEGSIYYLDTGVGKPGDIVKQINGIPGQPVDITTR